MENSSPRPVNGANPRGGGAGMVLLDNMLSEKGVVAGLLYKWVNIGKGWRPRWFVLEHGVLSYYKVEGPDKVSLVRELQRKSDVRVIGDECHKLVKKEKAAGTFDTIQRKVLGEVHMQVSTLRPSDADEKKFYIFSGTKTLHLRADSKEDRASWLEALQEVKELVTCDQLVVDLQPASKTMPSLAPLREKLEAAGLGETAVQECLQVVENDICGQLVSELKEERQKKNRLLLQLASLESEDLKLEAQVVHESVFSAMERRATEDGLSKRENLVHDMTEEEGEEEEGGMNEDPDDDGEDSFYEAAEEFAFIRRKLAANSLTISPNPNANTASESPTSTLAIDSVGFRYPYVERRESLPVPKFKEKSASLWSIIKDNAGKDLSHICLPVYFNEPISSLQKCFEEMEYSFLADRAAEYGRRGDYLMRALHVAAFAVSGYACTEGRSQKPFNPLLGETFEAAWEDKGCKFISEKVSHHPVIVACHCDGAGWKFWGDCDLRNKFWGPSITLEPTGVLSLAFDDGEVYEWTKVTTGIYNIILGKPYVEHYGTMKITSNRGWSIQLRFKERTPLIDRNPHQVRGFVQHESSPVKMATVVGKWDHSVYYCKGDMSKQQQKENDFHDAPDCFPLWQRAPPSPSPTRYNLTSFAITLNEITPGLEDRLPPTDSRLRPDQRALENGEYDYAFETKLKLETRQRKARKEQEAGWSPKWFEQRGPHGTYCYKGGYWEAREKKEWKGIPEIYNIDELEIAK